MQLFFENSRIHRDSNSQSESSFGSVRVYSLTLSYTPRIMRCDSWASLLARTFASLCLGREPKVRVATLKLFSTTIYTCICGIYCAFMSEGDVETIFSWSLKWLCSFSYIWLWWNLPIFCNWTWKNRLNCGIVSCWSWGSLSTKGVWGEVKFTSIF
jgi:hypothetical protein